MASTKKVPELIEIIVREYGIRADTIVEVAEAYLSEVYLLNKEYVIRGRKLLPSTLEKLAEEIYIINQVKSFVDYDFPELLTTANNQKYIVFGQSIFTLYRLIPGENVCTWYSMHLAKEEQTKSILEAQRSLHEKTKGKLQVQKESLNKFLVMVEARFAEIGSKLDQKINDRVKKAIESVRKYSSNVKTEDLCFVHGDYHHGNVLLDQFNRVSGLIDLDRVRIGHYLEDFAFTLMVSLRNYRTREFLFDQNYFSKLLDWYDFPREDFDTLVNYWILYIFSDYYVMLTEDPLPNSEVYLYYQKTYLEDICNRYRA